jgi:hypothetical protein
VPPPELPQRHRSSKRLTHPAGRQANHRPEIASAAVGRQRAQLPAFAPLLDELEVAGWTANRQRLAGSFHDWMLLGSGRILVTIGHTVGSAPTDPIESALVAQSVWTAVRAHALEAADAGALLSHVAQTLWPLPTAAVRACAAVALLNTAGGQASIAIAGDCLAWRVRAATCEPLLLRQPELGSTADFVYLGHSFQLSLRERLVLVADDVLQRQPKLASSIAADFLHQDAESHRRMTAADAVALVRQNYEPQNADAATASASIAAIRRR